MSDDEQEDSSSCPECGGQIINSEGYRVCMECGTIDSRDFVLPEDSRLPRESQERDKLYVSPANKMHIVDGLGSYIGHRKERYFVDAEGNPLSGKRQKRFKRLKAIYSVRVKIGKNEAKYRALRTLNHVSKLLFLSEQVRDRTAYLYKKIVADLPEKAPNNILLVAVCLLMAAREFKDQSPITLEEIASAFEKCGHRVNVRAIVREALRLKNMTGYAPQIRKPDDYIPRIVSMLMNNQRVKSKVKSRGWILSEYESALIGKIKQITELVSSTKRGGRNPFIFVAASAYAADRLIAETVGRRAILTQKLVSKATQVAEYSIRDHFGVIKQVLRSRDEP